MLIALACCGAMDTPLPHGGAPRSGYTVGPTTFAVLAGRGRRRVGDFPVACWPPTCETGTDRGGPVVLP